MKIFVRLSPKRFFGSKKKRSHVSRSDLSSFTAVGIKELEGREEVAAMVRELGIGTGRVISIDELMRRVGSVCDAELRETFDFFDKDGDGRITEEELLGAFKATGDERCTLEDCRRMIAAVDENKDGFVCFEDFSRMMDHHFV